MQNLNNHHIVVTGASEGLGFAMAKAFLGCGTRVTAIACNVQRLQRVRQLGLRQSRATLPTLG